MGIFSVFVLGGVFVLLMQWWYRAWHPVFRIRTSNEQLLHLKKVRDRAGVDNWVGLFNQAFLLLSWAVDRVEEGMVIWAVDEETQEVREVKMDVFDHIRETSPKPQVHEPVINFKEGEDERPN